MNHYKIKPKKPKLWVDDKLEINNYIIKYDKRVIIAVVRGKGVIILWGDDDFDDHLHDSEIQLKERLIYQILKVD